MSARGTMIALYDLLLSLTLLSISIILILWNEPLQKAPSSYAREALYKEEATKLLRSCLNEPAFIKAILEGEYTKAYNILSSNLPQEYLCSLLIIRGGKQIMTLGPMPPEVHDEMRFLHLSLSERDVSFVIIVRVWRR